MEIKIKKFSFIIIEINFKQNMNKKLFTEIIHQNKKLKYPWHNSSNFIYLVSNI